jgi:hypothetical protein
MSTMLSRYALPRRRRLAAIASLWSLVALMLLASLDTSGAGARGARATSHVRSSRCTVAARRNARKGGRKACKGARSPRRSKQLRSKKRLQTPVGSGLSGAGNSGPSGGLGEQSPVSAPAQTLLPGTAPVESPPTKTVPVELAPIEAPVQKPPAKEPPVKEPPVEAIPTATTVSSSVNPSKVGQAVIYTARVLPATAMGTVAFKNAGTPIAGCPTQTVSSGIATCAVGGYAAAGSNTITATYSGEGNYLTSTSVVTQRVELPAPFRFFAPTSFWNESVPADAPVDPNSAALVSAFDREIAAAEDAKEGMPTINTTAWSVPVYTVPATQAPVKVAQKALGGELNVALQSAWDAVPLPAEAIPAAGTDKDLVIWQPSTDKLWEFWGLEKTEVGWKARWGGAMDSASSDPGIYGPEAWPGASPYWGVSATSLSVAGGLITLEDLELGQINHALAIAIPNTRYGEYSSPAHRTDGYSAAPLSLPEGAHLRLDPSLNLASLHLSRVTLMLAEAAQRYGIFVRDSGANVAFVAQDPTPTGANPYAGAHGYFEGKSASQLLESFPWSYLELMKMELHSTS